MYEFLDVYVEIQSSFIWGKFSVKAVDGELLPKPISWREYRDAKGLEGYSLAGMVTEQNFGANVGFMATFQRQASGARPVRK